MMRRRSCKIEVATLVIESVTLILLAFLLLK